jgi:hypothetical protein
MSDYYEDSFESESGSENGEPDELGQAEAGVTQAAREVHQVAPNLLASPRLSAALRGSGSASDLEDQESSRARGSKSDRSPKPRMKFRVRKPNIGSLTQKIKNKLKKDSAVFGATLEVAVQRSPLGTDHIELPTVFRQCIDFLEEHGINHQGIYRLPGVKSKVEELKSHFDKGLFDILVSSQLSVQCTTGWCGDGKDTLRGAYQGENSSIHLHLSGGEWVPAIFRSNICSICQNL